MAVSGMVLFGFVLAHVAGNLKIFLGQAEFNAYARWLRQVGEPAVPHGGLLWLTRLILLASVAVHITAALQLARMNRHARGSRYVLRKTVQAGYSERTMIWTGLLVALYVVYHIMHLTLGIVHPHFLPEDPYRNVISGFRVAPVSAVYIAANLLLGLHLYHGLWSMFQSLGWNHPRYNSWRRIFAVVFAVVVTTGFVAVPLAVLVGVIS